MTYLSGVEMARSARTGGLSGWPQGISTPAIHPGLGAPAATPARPADAGDPRGERVPTGMSVPAPGPQKAGGS